MNVDTNVMKPRSLDLRTPRLSIVRVLRIMSIDTYTLIYYECIRKIQNRRKQVAFRCGEDGIGRGEWWGRPIGRCTESVAREAQADDDHT